MKLFVEESHNVQTSEETSSSWGPHFYIQADSRPNIVYGLSMFFCATLYSIEYVLLVLQTLPTLIHNLPSLTSSLIW